jgi:Enoyl-(Acyl carrier protein) reductase
MHQNSFLDVTSEQFDRVMKTNLYAPFWLCKAAIPRMAPGSCIINTVSIEAFTPEAVLTDYAMTKVRCVRALSVQCVAADEPSQLCRRRLFSLRSLHTLVHLNTRRRHCSTSPSHWARSSCPRASVSTLSLQVCCCCLCCAATSNARACCPSTTHPLLRLLVHTAAAMHCAARPPTAGPIWTPLIPSTLSKEMIESFGKQSPMQVGVASVLGASCIVHCDSTTAVAPPDGAYGQRVDSPLSALLFCCSRLCNRSLSLSVCTRLAAPRPACGVLPGVCLSREPRV